MQDFELLGSFYLGRDYDLTTRAGDPRSLVLYDSKHLVTHAVCVGMTGSGKTGLCLTLLEEAAIDSIPAIVIDPKGDLSNLLLTFPELRAEDFEPWVHPGDAAKRGLSVAQHAEAQARAWREGLAQWGQDGARIAKLRAAAEFRVYTPGSNAGMPVSILDSLRAPDAALREDAELYRERIASTATSLLCLLGVDADPIQSREHILLSNLFAKAWTDGLDLDLGALIRQIQDPPMSRIGVLELESFYPAKERFGLAMRFNNLLAAPGFATWMEGEPLDVGRLLHTPQGKPRVAIFSIAHLSDAERMFFVSLLLNQVLAWTRAQSGTSSLRALVYMDEIAGYFPPTAEPPSKRPLLLLMKQARAFGVGVVLATQNPVDLDYKGLSNAGTWFIGRLQTERDKARVLDGLEGAAAGGPGGFDRARVDATLSQLTNRVFLMHDVHADGPRVIEVRWALSYLRGPLTRAEIKRLSAPRAADGSAPSSSAPPPSTAVAPAPSTAAAKIAAPVETPRRDAAARTAAARPVLAPEIQQVFLPVRVHVPAGERVVYSPMLLTCATLYFEDRKLGVDVEQSVCLLAPLSTGLVAVDFGAMVEVDVTPEQLSSDAPTNAEFDPLAGEATKPKSYEVWKKQCADALYRSRALELLRSETLGVVSRPGEDERAFRVRCLHLARERRDEAAAKIRAKHGSKLTTLLERIRRSEQAVEVQKEQARDAKLSTALSLGGALLGALFSTKRSAASKASTAMRGASRAAREKGDIERAEETRAALEAQLADLEARIHEEVAGADLQPRVQTEGFVPLEVSLKKSNVGLRAFALAWAPCRVGADEVRRPAWKPA